MSRKTQCVSCGHEGDYVAFAHPIRLGLLRCPECKTESRDGRFVTRFTDDVQSATAALAAAENVAVLETGETMKPIKLKPCPACGGKPVRALAGGRWIECGSCGCEMFGPSNDPDGAKWNALPRLTSIAWPSETEITSYAKTATDDRGEREAFKSGAFWMMDRIIEQIERGRAKTKERKVRK